MTMTMMRMIMVGLPFSYKLRIEMKSNMLTITDAYDILTSCSLSTTTWNAAAATSALQSVNSTSATATATGSGAGATGTGSAASTGGSAAAASSTGGVNGAAGVSVPGLSSVAVMLAMGMGYLGVV